MASLAELYSFEDGLGNNSNYSPFTEESAYTIEDIGQAEEIASLESLVFNSFESVALLEKHGISMESGVGDFFAKVWEYIKKICAFVKKIWSDFVNWLKITFSNKERNLQEAIDSKSFEDATAVLGSSVKVQNTFVGNDLAIIPGTRMATVPNLELSEVMSIPKIGAALGFIYDVNIDVFDAMNRVVDRYAKGIFSEDEDIPKEIVAISNKYHFVPRTDPDELFFTILQYSGKFDTMAIENNSKKAADGETKLAIGVALSVRPVVYYDGTTRNVKVTNEVLKASATAYKKLINEVQEAARHSSRYQVRMESLIDKIERSINDAADLTNDKVKTLREGIRLTLVITRKIGNEMSNPHIYYKLPQMKFANSVEKVVAQMRAS